MLNLSSKFDKVKLAIVGGTGLYNLDSLKKVTEVNITTPWGQPSAPIIIAETPGGYPIAFLARHGWNHEYSPTEVPYAANIAALRSIGVEAIVGFSAVGSLREEIRPGDFVLIDQVIDRTKGKRQDSFFGGGVVAHASFGEPMHKGLREIIYKHRDSVSSINVHKDKTAITMEGPAFSTRAESCLYRSWGADVINMTCIPESKLAREAEIAYQLVCMSTDYDAWRESEACVTATEVMKTMSTNANNAKTLLLAFLEDLVKELYETDGTPLTSDICGSTKLAFQSPTWSKTGEAAERLKFLFPAYFE